MIWYQDSWHQTMILINLVKGAAPKVRDISEASSHDAKNDNAIVDHRCNGAERVLIIAR